VNYTVNWGISCDYLSVYTLPDPIPYDSIPLPKAKKAKRLELNEMGLDCSWAVSSASSPQWFPLRCEPLERKIRPDDSLL
jgi:hypothetical protein